MKKNMIEVGKLLKIGICYGVTLTLISCGDIDTAGETEVTDDQASIRTEETGTFGGDSPADISDALYSDFASANYFENLDTNNDNLLDENEYSTSLFNSWDTNNDGILRDNEWSTAVNDFGFDNNNAWAWSSWDANNDNRITEAEFKSGMGNTDMFASWDKNNDNMLDEREYAEGLVVIWTDADDDGVLDENEYKENVNRYFDGSEKQYQPERG
jgi:Ca2+-binding EF-hand superfamily protein